jgi:hypothetical protein
MIADSLINPALHFRALYVVGAVVTLLGFLFVNTASARDLVPRCCARPAAEPPAPPPAPS